MDVGIDNSSLAWGITFTVVLTVCASLLLVVFCICAHFLHKRRKPFSFFICHRKSSSGSFARLLKMFLQEGNRAKRLVFLDVDDHRDLPVLFDFVGMQTNTFVVLCTQDIFVDLQ